jgi:hypothetical protein
MIIPIQTLTEIRFIHPLIQVQLLWAQLQFAEMELTALASTEVELVRITEAYPNGFNSSSSTYSLQDDIIYA